MDDLVYHGILIFFYGFCSDPAVVISYPDSVLYFHVCGNRYDLWVWWAIWNARNSKNVLCTYFVEIAIPSTVFCHIDTENIFFWYLQATYINKTFYIRISAQNMSENIRMDI